MGAVQAANAEVELRILEAAERNNKECAECGESLSNDLTGDVCPGCGYSIYAGIPGTGAFMALATDGIVDPITARSSRAVH